MSTITGKQATIARQTEARTTGTSSTRQEPSSVREVARREVTHAEIRARAYEIYRARRGNDNLGDAISDWLRAERELKGAAPDSPRTTGVEVKAQLHGQTLLAERA